jgi:hypothetical protein
MTRNTDSSRNGYVYILSNPAMPGIVKVGRSIHGGKLRAKDLYKQGGTGIPMPFHMEFEVFHDDCVLLEKEVHTLLEKFRLNEAREFFRIDPDDAKIIILKVICSFHDFIVERSDLVILGYDLLENYGAYVDEEHPCLATLDLTHSLVNHLTKDEVRNAVSRYESACERRKLKLSAHNSVH